jgi:hypothetical protein
MTNKQRTSITLETRTTATQSLWRLVRTPLRRVRLNQELAILSVIATRKDAERTSRPRHGRGASPME